MGRVVLLTLVTAVLAGCGGDAPASPAADAVDAAGTASAAASEAPSANATAPLPVDAHADLTCMACHSGPRADREIGAVPRGACAASGCHSDAGPAEVRLNTVIFEHRGHGGGEPVAMACAGCHAHEDGREPLSAGTESCGLCHVDQLDGTTPSDCLACHQVPDHLGVTSQGVRIPHEGMPWIEGECVRCHYDVDVPRTTVSASTCASCHRDVADVTNRSIGEDVHPGHAQVACTSCHGESGHRIVAMSSAVALECSQCHVQSHGVRVTPSFPGSETCAACHRDTHTSQQRLLLGVVAGHPDATPSEKFMDGLTCRSCHVTPDAAASVAAAGRDAAVSGSDVSCSGCHRAEYATVLEWWNVGTDQRIRLVDAYLRRAGGLVGAGAPDTAQALLRSAEDLLALVREGGGQHNLPLAHSLLVTSLQEAGDAVRSAGGAAPAPPDLGRRPHMGVCSYCHYRTDDRMRFGEMDEAFHRQALGLDLPREGGGG